MNDTTTHLTTDLEQALSPPKALLYFTAPWCAPCKIFGPILEKFTSDHPDVTVIKIDADEKHDLLGLYEVRGIPTVIYLEYGAEKRRHTGLMTGEKLNLLFDL